MQPGGKGPLAYTGVLARRPPDTVVENRAPTSSDINFIVPTLWVDYSALDLYVLVNVAGTATWIFIPTNVAEDYVTDSGTAVPSALGDLNIFGGTGIQTAGSGNTITISSIGAGFDWEVVTDATQTLVAGTAYLANRGGGVTFSLPAAASVGDTFIICGTNAGGWVLDQQTGQTVDFNGVTTTTTTGTLTSTRSNDQIILVCSVANTEFVAFAPVGNLLVDGGTSNNSINSTTFYIDVDSDVVSVGTAAAPAKIRSVDADLSLSAATVCAAVDSASTNVGVSVASVEARSTGTVAAGFGSGIQFNADDDAGTVAAQGSARIVWTDPDVAGGYTSRAEWTLMNASTVASVAWQCTPSDMHLPNNAQTISGELSGGGPLTICSVNANDDRYFPSTSSNSFIAGHSDVQPNGTQSTWALNTNASGTSSNSLNTYGDMYMNRTASSPTNGFGAYLLMTGNSGSGNKANVGGYGWIWTDVTDSMETASLVLRATTSGTIGEVLRVSSTGLSTDGGTSNFLYEAGTFTPTISGSSAAGAGTYSVQVGRYSRMGNVVFVTGTMNWSAHTGTGNAVITDLPFTSVNVSQSGTVGALFLSNFAYTAGAVPMAIIVVNTTTANVNEITSGASAAVALDTAAIMRYSLNYFIG